MLMHKTQIVISLLRNDFPPFSCSLSFPPTTARPPASSSSSFTTASKYKKSPFNGRRRRQTRLLLRRNKTIPTTATHFIIVMCNFMCFVVVVSISRAIVNNEDLRQTTPWLQLWRNDFWGTPLNHAGSHQSWRPFCVLSFRFNFYFSGNFFWFQIQFDDDVISK